ncbi:MAG: hypothetical protein RMJ32_05820 [Aquificaceae bacterium]|nr:hypothetical protein [Aquificaceae bacterium]
MIKINLLKSQKIAKGPVTDAGVSAPTIKLGETLNYVLIAGFFLAVIVGLFIYSNNLKSQKQAIEQRIAELQTQKQTLQQQQQKILQEKQQLEQQIAAIKVEIERLENAKDVILGMKDYYPRFSSGLNFYTKNLPTDAWMNAYRQSINLNDASMNVEFELNSLNFETLSSYGKKIEDARMSMFMGQIERKVNQAGFEYFTTKVTSQGLGGFTNEKP